MTKPKNNSLTKDEVKHVAKLSDLPLDPNEVEKFQEQLSETVNYFDELNQLDTKNVSPTAQVTGKTNELRSDEITPGLSADQVIKNAPKNHNGFFESKVEWN